MKKNIKKIIVGIFSFALLFTAQNTFAATWNGASNDCKGISIVNATTNEGYARPCWPSSSISADAGDTLNIRIYYHNTGTATANNTRVFLSAPTGSDSTSKSFSGNITSDQGDISLGNVVANLSSSQTITFNSVKWYTNNTSETLTALPNGQSGAEILSGGLNIGSIAPGWSTQGSLVVSFHVSNNTVTQLCREITATNYLGALPCTYPDQICRVTSATNYLGALPCVYYTQPNNTCRITNFDADDTSIEDGDLTSLRWSTENCSFVSITGLASGLSRNGSYSVYPNYTKTYTLNAYGSYGSDSESLKIYVDEDNNDLDCSIDSFTASDTYIDNGDSSVLKWRTTDCENISISSIGSVDEDDSKTVYPSNTTTYTLRAYGDNGTKTKSITVNVNYNNTTPVIIYNSNVVTTVATNISQTGAQLNGLITNSNYKNSNVHFEYGTSVNLGSRTLTRTLNNTTNFNEYISGLSPNTIYYFQAFSEGSNGDSRGSIEVFRTLGNVTGTNTNTVNTTRTIFVQGTTVTGSESPIILKIENRYQSIGTNDIIEYTVYYKNIGNVTLRNPILQVIVPKGIILTNYTKGTYAQDTNTLTIQLYDLVSGEEGFINLQGQVVLMPVDTAQIVTTAVLVYTNTNGSQENAMAYVLNSQKIINNNNNLLGASAFFSGIFPSSLIGWLFLIIIILLLILIARSLYNRRDVTTTTTQKTISHEDIGK